MTRMDDLRKAVEAIESGTPPRVVLDDLQHGPLPACNCDGEWWGAEHVTGCPLGPTAQPEITARRMVHTFPVPAELLEDQLPPWDVMMAQMEAAAAAFAALPPEEQQRITAERKAAYEAERCTACGCHPDEHGG